MTSFKDFVKPAITVKYCFVDFDGTLREMGPTGWAPEKPEEVKVFPWVPARLQEAKEKGYVIVGITNQQYLTKTIGADAVDAVCAETVRQTGMQFPYVFSKTPDQSKPNIFMFEKAESVYGPANKNESVMIGDMPDKDGKGAENFGIRFIPVEEFKLHGVP